MLRGFLSNFINFASIARMFSGNRSNTLIVYQHILLQLVLTRLVHMRKLESTTVTMHAKNLTHT